MMSTSDGIAGLDCLFAPRAIAVVGASSDAARIGGRPIDYMLRAGYTGRIFPVNPTRTELQGLRCWPDLASIDAEIDLAIIAVHASLVMSSIEAAAAKGAQAAVIFSAGFSELGEGGEALQNQLAVRCRELGVRALGPNCLGLFNARTGVMATFASCLQEGPALDGPVALVCQSGAYGSYIAMLARRRGVGIGQWITTGNEMDVGIEEAIAYLAEDPAVKVIGCAAEGIRNGAAFIAALERAHGCGKPVVILKMGKSEGGARAAKSHTAALAVDDAVLDAVIRQARAARVDTTEEFLDLLYAFSRCAPPAGSRLGIVSVSGGAGVLLADAASLHGLTTPPMPDDVQAELVKANPLGSMANPIDVTAQAINDFDLFRAPLRAMVKESYDAFVGFFMNYLASDALRARLVEVLDDIAPQLRGRPFAVVTTDADEAQNHIDSKAFLAFEDPDRAVAALSSMARIAKRLGTALPSPPVNCVMPIFTGAERTEAELKAVLAKAGIGVPVEKVAATPAAAAVAAATFGGAVALKIVSPDIAHKSDVGGVRLGLRGADEVLEAANTMAHGVAVHAPDARIDGFLVTPMAEEGFDMIAGAVDDPVFGPMLMVGLGGIYVEILGDVAFRYGAISEEEALAMLGELRGKVLLEGARGREPADVGALAQALSRLSQLAVANTGRFAAIEINPLRVLPAGRGCLALDALLTLPERPVQGDI